MDNDNKDKKDYDFVEKQLESIVSQLGKEECATKRVYIALTNPTLKNGHHEPFKAEYLWYKSSIANGTWVLRPWVIELLIEGISSLNKIYTKYSKVFRGLHVTGNGSPFLSLAADEISAPNAEEKFGVSFQDIKSGKEARHFTRLTEGFNAEMKRQGQFCLSGKTLYHNLLAYEDNIAATTETQMLHMHIPVFCEYFTECLAEVTQCGERSILDIIVEEREFERFDNNNVGWKASGMKTDKPDYTYNLDHFVLPKLDGSDFNDGNFHPDHTNNRVPLGPSYEAYQTYSGRSSSRLRQEK